MIQLEQELSRKRTEYDLEKSKMQVRLQEVDKERALLKAEESMHKDKISSLVRERDQVEERYKKKIEELNEDTKRKEQELKQRVQLQYNSHRLNI